MLIIPLKLTLRTIAMVVVNLGATFMQRSWVHSVGVMFLSTHKKGKGGPHQLSCGAWRLLFLAKLISKSGSDTGINPIKSN